MGNHWFVYKNQKQKGPYTWTQLWREAQAGRIKPRDLVWNKTMKDWVQAAQVPGLISNVRKRNYLTIAVAVSAVFFIVLSGTAFYYLFFYTGPQLAALENDNETAQVEDPGDEENLNETETEIDDQPDNQFVSNQDRNRTENDSNREPDPDPEPEPEEPAEQTISFQGGTYTGPLKDGQPHGYGTWNHPDGRRYEGDFADGSIEGYGTMTFPGGERYTGFFKNGLAHGEGTMIHPDGRQVSGEWVEGVYQEENGNDDEEPDDEDNNDNEEDEESGDNND